MAEENSLITAMLEEARKQGYIIAERDLPRQAQTVLAIAEVTLKKFGNRPETETIFKAAVSATFGITFK